MSLPDKLDAEALTFREGFLAGRQEAFDRARFALGHEWTRFRDSRVGVHPRKGGTQSLYCYDCGEWVYNTADFEMSRGGFAHSHSCTYAR